MTQAGADSPPKRHPGRFPKHIETILAARVGGADYGAFDRAIRLLEPLGRNREIVGLFGGRWRYGAIKLWRYGHRAPPREAVAILCARLGEMQRVCAELAGELPKLPGPGRGSHRNICKWNRERAMRKAAENR